MAKLIKRLPSFDVAVGLGADCQIAYQLARNGFRGPAYPFDWLVTPFTSLYNLLKNDFKDWILKEDLFYRPKHVLDNKYGVHFLHDFQYKDFKTFLCDYQKHYDKYMRRIDRFRELLQSDKRVLFIRREVTQDQAIQLNNLLKFRCPNLNYKLAALDEKQFGVHNIITARNLQKRPYDWKGDNVEWDRFFKMVQLTKLPKVE